MNSKFRLLYTLMFSILMLFYSQYTRAHEIDSQLNKANSHPSIITLSPHLTEIVFALGLGERIVAVSDYSDYPEKASKIPSVASYQGANITEIYRLNPSHVLVWKGGNKDSDINLLKNGDFALYESTVHTFKDLLTNITEIGDFLNANSQAQALVNKLSTEVLTISKLKSPPVNAIYYLNVQPLVGLGSDKWLNDLLSMCNIKNLYQNEPSAYPQLNLADVLRKQPDILIAATKQSIEQVEQHWNKRHHILNARYVTVNPDALHRFTPRAIYEISSMCRKLQQP